MAKRISAKNRNRKRDVQSSYKSGGNENTHKGRVSRRRKAKLKKANHW